jgi:hypothetical protein
MDLSQAAKLAEAWADAQNVVAQCGGAFVRSHVPALAQAAEGQVAKGGGGRRNHLAGSP